jgi:hypothetical protein
MGRLLFAIKSHYQKHQWVDEGKGNGCCITLLVQYCSESLTFTEAWYKLTRFCKVKALLHIRMTTHTHTHTAIQTQCKTMHKV